MQIDLQNINKHFGSVHANRNITLSLGEGRIIGILGENGAGKSTLMKILSGYQTADSGTVAIDGKVVDYRNPQTAIAHGVGMLQQDPLDIGAFTVLENFSFGSPAQGWINRLFDNRSALRQSFSAITKRFGFEIDPAAYISDLSIAQRQQLEIVRLLSQNVRTLILDEPTTGISTEQKDLLFKTLREMSNAGMTILLVSHKLEEVIALCDEVIVLRQGAVVGQQKMPITKQELVAMMFGADLPTPQRTRRYLDDESILLDVHQLHLHQGRLDMRGIDLEVRRGEIIGFAGLDGSGQELLLRACAGLVQPQGGTIHLYGRNVTGFHYHDLQKLGVVFRAAGRLEEGLIAGLTLTEHVALVENTGFLIDWQGTQANTQAKIQHYQVRGTPEHQIEQLSGGNQQRVLMSLLPELPTVMILEQPMRGLDVDSSAWIWEQLIARCEAGSALLFSSPDLDELLTYSDRIVVCFAGQTILIDNPASTTSTQLGHIIGGEFEQA